MFIRKIIIGLLSFYYIEVRTIARRSGLTTPESIERIFEKKKQKEKRKERPYDNSKWKKRKAFREKTFALKGSHSKDRRFSNQRSLRRMFRNS